MSDNKKYYYIKLKDSFFDSPQLRVLEGMQDGYLYSNVLLKMYLASIKNDGCLVMHGSASGSWMPYNVPMLAALIGHKNGDVQTALDIFQQLGLIEILDSGAIYMLDIQTMIGHSSTEADRKRAYRRRIEQERNGTKWEVISENREVDTKNREVAETVDTQGLQATEGKNREEMGRKNGTNVHQRLEIRDKRLDTNTYADFGKSASDSPKSKNPATKDVEARFEALWKMYPRKEGKGKVSDKRKRIAYDMGEEMERAIERYIKFKASTNTERQYLMAGSTWFNSGYVDYTDTNYRQTMGIKEEETCAHCQNTGRTPDGTFCDCKHGLLLKARQAKGQGVSLLDGPEETP